MKNKSAISAKLILMIVGQWKAEVPGELLGFSDRNPSCYFGFVAGSIPKLPNNVYPGDPSQFWRHFTIGASLLGRVEDPSVVADTIGINNTNFYPDPNTAISLLISDSVGLDNLGLPVFRPRSDQRGFVHTSHVWREWLTGKHNQVNLAEVEVLGLDGITRGAARLHGLYGSGDGHYLVPWFLLEVVDPYSQVYSPDVSTKRPAQAWVSLNAGSN